MSSMSWPSGRGSQPWRRSVGPRGRAEARGALERLGGSPAKRLDPEMRRALEELGYAE